MEPLIGQLERLRRRTRVLLVVLRGSAWVAGLVACAMLAGLADFALRLPGWMRLALLVAGAGAALFYLARWMARAARVDPSLPTLALRLETLYPAAAGRLASAVAFATEPPREIETPLGAHLTHRTTEASRGVLADEQIGKLIDPRPTLRAVGGMIVAMSCMAGVALGAPEPFRIAVARWTNPLGDARWPNRYRVESLTERRVAPNNAPIPFAARVSKGDRENLRTWVVYRFTEAGRPVGEWQRALMTRQIEGGRYERPVEPLPRADGVEFRFEAGDDATDTQALTLITPPTLTAFSAEAAPPPYAAGALTADPHNLLMPPRPAVTVEALEGSRVTLRLTVEGSFTLPEPEPSAGALRGWIAESFPGLLDEVDADAYREMDTAFTPTPPDATGGASEGGEAGNFEIAFNLLRPARFRLRFADAYGSRYEDPRLFVFEVREDRPPRVAVTLPKGDESVLPTATLPVASEAFDDVAIASLDLEARTAGRPPLPLAHGEKGGARQQAAGRIDLAPLALKPGDEVALIAIARDTFNLAGRTHDPVESLPRKLRIIGEQDLARQVHAQLADLRQRALRAQAMQKGLAQAPPSTAAVQQQQDLTRRIEQMGASVEEIRSRIEANRLDDAPLKQALEASAGLLRDAGGSSEQAAGQLTAAAADPDNAQQPTDRARAAQAATERKLDALAQLLDEGREAYELRQKLVKLSKEQEALGDRVREDLPRTLGRPLEDLTDEQRRQLAENAQRQAELAREAADLTQRMRSTAAAISRQSTDADQQAMAEALRQASETATEQSLEKTMEEASQQVERNRLADARQSQDAARQTLRQMLEEINRADRLRQEILRRKLAELVEAIRKLHEQQRAQLDRLVAAQRYDDLDAPLLTLRRNTLAVAETARAADAKAAPIGDRLDSAANDQSLAAVELRKSPVDPVAAETHERAALGDIAEALRLAEELARQAQQQLTDEERRKLIEQYQQALALQREVQQETQRLDAAPEADRTRRWRADALKAGKRQETVAQSVKGLGEQVRETIVYRNVHDQVERWSASAAEDLAAAKPDGGTLFHQRLIIGSIESLIAALERDPPDEDQFAEGEGGGGGGQGGQQGQAPPLIPPVAELKLLKARQVTVHAITRELEGVSEDELRATILREAAGQQKSLAESGDRLLEALQQQPRAVPAPQPTD